MAGFQPPPVDEGDLHAIMDYFIAGLKTRAMIEQVLEGLPKSKAAAILSWLEEHGIHSDADFLLNFGRLLGEVNEEWTAYRA
jgi:hypothetical protein